MKNWQCILLLVLSFHLSASGAEKKPNPQDEYERSIQSVVRGKYFYKTGRLEAGLTGGVMPYDSLVNHYMFGGRLTWHLHDHFGWEIVDMQYAFPSTTSYATDLVKAKGLSNMQTSRLKYLATTNFLLSPFYGKIRFFGSQVLYFDIYFVLGGGLAKTETIKLSTSATGVAATESIQRSGFEPVVDWGGGIKIFMSDYVGVMLDLRNYMVLASVYDKKSFKSNFSVFAGLVLTLPAYP